MNIADEIREYVQSWRDTPSLMDDLDAGDIDGLLGDFEHIADRIDAEHERLMEERADRYSELRTTLKERYVELPKDADGEYIHIGDVMEVINSKQRAEACYVQMGPSGTWAVGLTKNCHWYDTESLRHHHAPTVEDVLREFAMAVCKDDALTIRKDVVDEYAAKLQLKEEE